MAMANDETETLKKPAVFCVCKFQNLEIYHYSTYNNYIIYSYF